MKTIKYVLLIFCLTIFVISFYNCGGDGSDDPDPPTKKEQLTALLVNKSGGWSLNAVTVPTNTATEEGHWASFKLAVSASTMTTSGHATGAGDVWSSGGWTMNEAGTSITRVVDGVVMSISSLTATKFTVSFTVPEGTVIDGRITALDGDYIFDLD